MAAPRTGVSAATLRLTLCFRDDEPVEQLPADLRPGPGERLLLRSAFRTIQPWRRDWFDTPSPA